MAPPAIINLENYSDTQFRDVVHRRSMLVAPTANVLQKMYHHVAGDGTVRLSGAELMTTDAGGNVQYSLMLGTSAAQLSANTLTAANLSSWTASSVYTATRDNFTVRSANLIAGNITCTSINLTSDVEFANANITSLVVTGDTNIDTNTLRVNSVANRVGIVQSNPQYPLDVTGDVNTTGVLRIGGTQVLSGTTLASSVTNSGLTSVGTLGTLNVTGNVRAGNLSTNSISATAITASGPLTVNSSNNTFDAMSTVTLTRTIFGTAVGSGVDIGKIGQISTFSGTGMVELRITSNTPNNQVTKAYTIPFNANLSWVGSRRALPYTSVLAMDNDVGVDVQIDNGTLDLKLVRTLVDEDTVDATTPYQISLIVHYNKGSNYTLANSWTPSDVWYTSTIPAVVESSNIAPGTAITQSSTRLSVRPFTGICTDNPGYTLDVNGGARVRGNLIVGQGVNDRDSTIFAVGTNHAIDCRKFYSANVFIASSIDLSGTHVANITYVGSYVLNVNLLQGSNANNTISKAYTIPITSGLTMDGAVWNRVLPTSTSGYNGTGTILRNDLDLDIQVTGAYVNLAVVRSKTLPESVNTSAPICVTMEASYNKYYGDVNIREASGEYTGFDITSTSNYFSRTVISSGPNGIGFNIDPKLSNYGFDVDAGRANFRGGFNLDNIYSDRCYLSFGNTWRLFLNPTTQNLEIQYNNDPNDVTWTSNVRTGILAAK